jgi:hypothetical protein
MRPFTTFLALVAVVLLSGGCSRTYISTGDPGVPSLDGDTRLCLTAHGAYGRSYIDRTGKLLDVTIKRGAVTNETILFSQRYRFVGSDLWGAVEWSSTNVVTIQVYDWGDGVGESDAQKRGTPSNHIATLSFYLDKQTGKFHSLHDTSATFKVFLSLLSGIVLTVFLLALIIWGVAAPRWLERFFHKPMWRFIWMLAFIAYLLLLLVGYIFYFGL